MGRARTERLGPEAVAAYLRRRFGPSAELGSLTPLGRGTQEGLKAYGYGHPLRVDFVADGAARSLVLRTMSPDPFGHDRRSDRAAVLYGAYDTFAGVSGHVQPIDVGAFDDDGELVPMAHGEPFLITEFVEGALYAHDLAELAPRQAATEEELQRARVLARWLVALHAQPAPPGAHTRDVRDTVGSGEGIFGLCDSYPADDPVAPPARLERLERLAVSWRWRLRGLERRAAHTHGDFHPFNLLFDDAGRLAVLDLSRGGVGEPADDVTCLSLNYLFFAMRAHGEFRGAARDLWDALWGTYLAESGDGELLTVVAPFFAWRALVLASPVWYPDVERDVREALFGFVEHLLEGASFDPQRPELLLTTKRGWKA